MTEQLNRIINGDSLEVLKTLPDESVDLVCTDPPYGYSFMGKDWDKAVPSVELWKECLRVLKPGAFAFVMSAPRQDVLSQMIVRMSEAGFDMDFTSIYWTYASGFPKAGNISKLVDKRFGGEREVVGENPNQRINKPENDVYEAGIRGKEAFITISSTPQAKELDGSYAGFQPKPAVEIIIVAMKPLSEKTYVDQALKNRKGITWLDDARIPHNEEVKETIRGTRLTETWEDGSGFKNEENTLASANPNGRFPANLLVSDDVLNDGKILKSGDRNPTGNPIYGGNSLLSSKTLDTSRVYKGDSGSFSRYFDLDKWADKLPDEVKKVFPFLIVPKASKSEKNKGLDDFIERRKSNIESQNMENALTGSGNVRNVLHKNFHPTVKPIKLMSYLITLGSRRGDIVLDPFSGSGTTCIAAKMLGRKFIGIDLSKEYCEIAEARLKALEPANTLNKFISVGVRND